MSYITLQNTCNPTSLAAEQTINNKPHYTPGKELKKAYKLLRRFFKPTTSGKVIINAEKQITARKANEVTERQQNHEAEADILNDSILTACSMLSAEEYENELNESAELAAVAKRVTTAE